jgi:hypothetical protein
MPTCNKKATAHLQNVRLSIAVASPLQARGQGAGAGGNNIVGTSRAQYWSKWHWGCLRWCTLEVPVGGSSGPSGIGGEYGATLPTRACDGVMHGAAATAAKCTVHRQADGAPSGPGNNDALHHITAIAPQY